MTNRYTSVEAVGTFTADAVTFGANRHDLDVISEDITPERGHIYPATSTGRTKRGRIIGPKSWSGSIEAPLFPISVPSLIYYSLGSSVFTADTPAVGTERHVLSQAITIPNFITEIGRDDQGHGYTGCVATGCSIDYAPDATMTAAVDVFFRKEQPRTALDAITFEDFDIVNRAFGGVEVTPGLGAVNATPATVTFMEAATVSWTNEFSDDAFSLGSEFLPANIVATFEATGSFDFRFTDTGDAYDDVVSSTNKSLNLDASYGAGATLRQVIVRSDSISYDSTTLPTDSNQRYVQTVEFTCENASGAGDSAAGKPVEVEIINTQDNTEFTA